MSGRALAGDLAVGFTGSTLDRGDHLRQNAAALAEAAGDWRARLLKLDALDPELDGEGRLVWTSLAEAADDAELIFLGLDGGRPRFAAATPRDRPGGMRSPVLARMLDVMPAEEASTYAAARSVVDWHARHRFCARCGAASVMFRGGWGRRCDACATEHFPRVDPVVIMLAEHNDRVLLGRSPGFAHNRYSALAGFLEPGESIEEAVAREVHEEAGVRVRRVRYIASQPWPFSSSLMIACIAEAVDDALTIDTTELEHAMWVSRADVARAMAGDPDAPFIAPPPYAIAHTLLTAWLGEGG